MCIQLRVRKKEISPIPLKNSHYKKKQTSKAPFSSPKFAFMRPSTTPLLRVYDGVQACHCFSTWCHHIPTEVLRTPLRDPMGSAHLTRQQHGHPHKYSLLFAVRQEDLGLDKSHDHGFKDVFGAFRCHSFLMASQTWCSYAIHHAAITANCISQRLSPKKAQELILDDNFVRWGVNKNE